MFTLITCPACQHKLTVPEGAMGIRRICPNCQSPFVAGASVAEASAPQRHAPASPVLGAPAYGQTMLAEPEQPIRYNCPRCKKPLEAPASEGGTKKPCPACGQRLQVPAAPPRAAAPQPNLNRTILATDESRAQPFSPQGGQPASYPGAAAAAPPAPAGMTLPGLGSASPQVRLATLIAAAVFVLLLLGCVLPAVIRGGREVDQPALAHAQQELERLRAEMAQNKAQMEKQQQAAEEQRRGWEKLLAEQQARQEKLELQRQLDRDNEAYRNDRQLKQLADAKREQEQRDIERQKREAEDKMKRDAAETQARLDAMQKKLEEANAKATTIVTQPAPVVVHPPWSPYYYRPWWGW